MDYDEVLAQVISLLQKEKRLSYRVLKLHLQLGDDILEALKEDLLYAKKLAVDEEGKVLVWAGDIALAVAPVAGPQQAATQENHPIGGHVAPDELHTPDAERRQLTVLFCGVLGALTLWILGYPDQELRGMEETLTRTRRLAHPFTLAQALAFSALLHQLRREPQVALAQTEGQRALCTEQGFATYLAWGMMPRGWALAAQGQVAEGLAQLREGFASWRTLGGEGVPAWPWFLALWAEACGKGGQLDEGLRALEEAMERMQHKEERLYEAEVYRLKGELLLQAFTTLREEAEACFHHALDLARCQQAKAWELRAAMSLSRLWLLQGRLQEAPALLVPVYSWLTEGFDTPDLQDAKALLETLS